MALLRHDVDLDLLPALRLARWQQKRGIRASFCVLTSSDCYNPFSSSGRRLLLEIQECGGEIALHLDSTLVPIEQLQDTAREEAARLSRVIGRPVRSLSLHGPHRLQEIPLLEGFLNAYDPAIFGPGRYLSDSSRNFRQDPWDFLKSAPDAIQLLFHPLHFSETVQDYPEIFAEQTLRWLGRVDEEHRSVSPHFRKTFPEKSLAERSQGFLQAFDQTVTRREPHMTSDLTDT